jgi:hypothetical protein
VEILAALAPEAAIERPAMFFELLIILIVGLIVPRALMTDNAQWTSAMAVPSCVAADRPWAIGRPPAL